MRWKDVGSYRYDGSYAFELYDRGRVIARSVNPSVLCHPDEILYVMATIADTEDSIGISCSQGKDRTGVYCAMIESLAGVSYEEVRADYLLSMCNCYGIVPYSVEYDTVGSMVLDRLFYIFQHPELLDSVSQVDWGCMDIADYDAERIVTGYLTYIGMSEERSSLLKESLTGQSGGEMRIDTMLFR